MLGAGYWLLAGAVGECGGVEVAAHPTFEELYARDFTPRSETSRSRLTIYFERVYAGQRVQTQWTSLSPYGPISFLADIHGWIGADGQRMLFFDALKIDGSFVRGVVSDRDDAAIVQAIIGLAKNLGMRVVAEGLETAEQMAFLTSHQCEEAQGYLISRPLPAGEFAKLFIESTTANQL